MRWLELLWLLAVAIYHARDLLLVLLGAVLATSLAFAVLT